MLSYSSPFSESLDTTPTRAAFGDTVFLTAVSDSAEELEVAGVAEFDEGGTEVAEPEAVDVVRPLFVSATGDVSALAKLPERVAAPVREVADVACVAP